MERKERPNQLIFALAFEAIALAFPGLIDGDTEVSGSDLTDFLTDNIFPAVLPLIKEEHARVVSRYYPSNICDDAVRYLEGFGIKS